MTLPAPHVLAAPDALAADAAPVAAGTPGADFGPRFKPESNQDTPRPELAPVAPHPASDVDPIWSADGRYLAFRSNRAGSWDLWAIPMKESKPAGEPSHFLAKRKGRRRR